MALRRAARPTLALAARLTAASSEAAAGASTLLGQALRELAPGATGESLRCPSVGRVLLPPPARIGAQFGAPEDARACCSAPGVSIARLP